MPKAVPREGLRAPLFFIVILASANVSAQGVSQEDLQRCSRLDSADARLACFDALAEPVSAPIDQEPSGAVATAAEPAEAAENPVAAKVEPADMTESAEPDNSVDASTAAGVATAIAVADDWAEAPDASASSRDAPPELQPAEVVADESPQVAAAAATASAAADSMPDELGDRYIDGGAQEEDEAIVATVDNVRVGYGRRLIFHFDNGQVWQQRNKDYIVYPKDEPFEVEISRGMMGDYRLRVGGEGRMTRIVRVE